MTDKNRNNAKQTVKNSIILSGLVGTAGLFIAKLLGLLYSIPLSSILASDELMSYYGSAYLIYSYVLNVFTAGIPFAISTLVAKYTVLDDSRSVLKIKKISQKLLMLMGLAGMILLVLLAGFIAPLITGSSDNTILVTALRILALAIFFVPLLSSYRGFWQGRKEMVEYAFSETFEQIVRVGFLLSVSYMVVYILHWDRKFALYAAVLSTSVAAFAGIVQIYFFDKKNVAEIQDAAKAQKKRSVKNQELLHELLVLAVPYLLTAVIGYCDNIFNSILLPVGLRAHGYTPAENQIILSAFNYVAYKLTSIPQILAPGFVAALIPHITEALTVGDREKVGKGVTECIGIVLFIGSFLSAIIAIYASDVFHILYYSSDPVLSASVVRWHAIEGFLGTICPVVSTLMIALGLKKSVLRRQLISAVLKGIIMVPCIYLFGFRGAVLSSVIGNVYVFAGNLYEIHQKYEIDFTAILKNLVKIALTLVITAAVAYGLRRLGIAGDYGPKLIAFVKLCVNGIIVLVTYFGISQLLKIPQELFHKDILSVLKSRLRRA